MSYTSLNHVTVSGNITHDPELHELSSGRAVCHIRLACNGRRRNADGAYEQKPNYFDVSVFGARGVNVHRYLQRGSGVAITGRLDWSEWQTTEGDRRQSVTVIADEVLFLNAPPGASSREGADELEAGEEELRASQAGAHVELVA